MFKSFAPVPGEVVLDTSSNLRMQHQSQIVDMGGRRLPTSADGVKGARVVLHASDRNSEEASQRSYI